MKCECSICKNNIPFDLPKEIVEVALKGDLVLFCGAGISTENKNVLPYSFYSSIKEELGIKSDSISFSSLMQKYCNEPNGRKKLLIKIHDRFNYIHSFPELERQATSFHRELSEIHPIQTIITTNWDTYFEDYCGAIPITIPDDFAFWDEYSRFVLKIHGSINNLSSIIATEEDYKKCLDQLRNGIIGATLKTILATKTVVFVGFSFGDEDFNQIIDYLRKEMGAIYPHVYFVTLDTTLKDRLNYQYSTSIITSGTYFVHQLKLELIQRGAIKNYSVYPIISSALANVEKLHDKISRIDLSVYPSVIYSLAYQDGVIHAFERFLQNYHTGEYNCPDVIGRLGREYKKIVSECHASKNYWDEAYYEGYLNGVVLIGACGIDPTAIEYFSFIYLPNAKEPLTSVEVFKKELDRVSTMKSKYHRFAKKIVEEKCDKGMVVHHPPF